MTVDTGYEVSLIAPMVRRMIDPINKDPSSSPRIGDAEGGPEGGTEGKGGAEDDVESRRVKVTVRESTEVRVRVAVLAAQ